MTLADQLTALVEFACKECSSYPCIHVEHYYDFTFTVLLPLLAKAVIAAAEYRLAGDEMENTEAAIERFGIARRDLYAALDVVAAALPGEGG